jgi:RNA recognition motif. (a.k.a. RRM, RBD, or RNP domain)
MSFQDEDFLGIGFSSAPTVESVESSADVSSSSCLPQPDHPFIPASIPPFDADRKAESAASSSNTPPSTIEADAQNARLRAMEIVRKFQASNHQHNHPSNFAADSSAGNYHSTFGSMLPAAELKRQRDACLERLQQREHRALLKNLEYLAKVEEERLQHRLEQIEQAKAYEQHVHQQYQNHQQYQQQQQQQQQHQQWGPHKNNNMALSSQAGIGTELRQRVEDQRKRTTNNMDSVAVYVANLPPSADEALLRSLFSSHGSIRKVHFYVDKATGRPKGDALVIYSHDGESTKTQLLEAVCSQLNGCELPGSDGPLLVQPSDPLYKLKSNKNQQQQKNDHTYYGPSETRTTETVSSDNSNELEKATPSAPAPDPGEANEDGGKQDDDDLDDFFDSLE